MFLRHKMPLAWNVFPTFIIPLPSSFHDPDDSDVMIIGPAAGTVATRRRGSG